jgi:FimV-like protein
VFVLVVVTFLLTAGGFSLGKHVERLSVQPFVDKQVTEYDALFRAACVPFEEENFHCALRIFERLRDEHLPPKVEKEVVAKQVQCLHYLGKSKEALRVIDTALHEHGHIPLLLHQKADILLATKNYREARQVIGLLADNRPGPRVWLSRGKLYMELEDYARAVENLELVLTAGTPALQREAAILLAGLYAERIKDFDKANRCVGIVLESDPWGIMSLTTAGRVFLVQGRYEEARAHLMKAVAQEPGNVNALLNLALVFDRQGQKNGQALYLEMAKNMDPESPIKYQVLRDY